VKSYEPRDAWDKVVVRLLHPPHLIYKYQNYSQPTCPA
jgi:hypothetical protein